MTVKGIGAMKATVTTMYKATGDIPEILFMTQRVTGGTPETADTTAKVTGGTQGTGIMTAKVIGIQADSIPNNLCLSNQKTINNN